MQKQIKKRMTKMDHKQCKSYKKWFCKKEKMLLVGFLIMSKISMEMKIKLNKSLRKMLLKKERLNNKIKIRINQN